MVDKQTNKMKHNDETSPQWITQWLRELIFEENERLRRLIYNLYLNFRLEYLPEQQLYDDICRNVTQYFHVDSCALYLVGQDAKEGPASLETFYELKGAFGPYDRALRPQYVRRQPKTRYPLYTTPLINEWQHNKLGMTEFALFEDIPTFYPSRMNFRHKPRKEGESSPQDPADTVGQLVWYQDNLYNTSRNIIFAPIFLFEDDEDLSRGMKRQADGLLKIENRAPRMIPAYGTAGPNHFFTDLWALAALRPYIRDLLASEDYERPAQDNEGWRRHYNDHRLGKEYFEVLVGWLNSLKDDIPNEGQRKGKITQILEGLSSDIGKLLNFVTEAEMLLQNLNYAQTILQQVQSGKITSYDLAYAPSLFNMNNLLLVWISRKQDKDKKTPKNNTVFGKLWNELNRLNIEDIAKEVLNKIFPVGVPSAKEKANFKITEQSLENLESEKVPDDVLEKLKSIKNQEFTKEEEFVGLLKTTIGEEQLVQFKSVILKHAAEKDFISLLDDVRVEPSQERLKILKSKNGEHINLSAGVKILIERIKDIAGCILNSDVILHADDMRISNEEKIAFRIAKRIQQQEEDQRIPDEEKRLMTLLSELSAIASMHCHTFNETDVFRMMFVANHVSQVLHNHILQQARRMKIEASSEELSSLRLTLFGLETLKEIEKVWQDVAEELEYKVRRYLTEKGNPPYGISRQPFSLKEFLRYISPSQGAEGEQEFPLITLTASFRNQQLASKAENILEDLSLLKELEKLAGELKARAKKAEEDTIAPFEVTCPNQNKKDVELSLMLQWKPTNFREQKCLLAFLITLRKMRKVVYGGKEEEAPEGKTAGGQKAQSQSPDSSVEQKEQAEGSDRPKWEEKIRNLRRADSALRRKIKNLSDSPVEELLKEITNELGSYCQAIADVVETDSCAVFFLIEDERNEDKQKMIMQGAWGNLEKTLKKYTDEKVNEKDRRKGVEYEAVPSHERNQYKNLLTPGPTQEEQRRKQAKEQLSQWSTTQQIWHLGDGRIANGRIAMAALSQKEDRVGQGDQWAYPSDNDAYNEAKSSGETSTPATLQNIFRCFLGIPIFARGGRWEPLPLLEQTGGDVPFRSESAQIRQEFLQRYRVVGILKVEGKHPQRPERDAPSDAEFERACREIGAYEKCKQQTKNCEECLKETGIDALLRKSFRCEVEENEEVEKVEKLLRDKGKIRDELVDALTHVYEADFTSEDAELAVTIAMQLGRLI